MAPEPERARRSAPSALSRLTLSLAGTVRPAEAALLVAQVRRARAAGVTSFDLVEAADPLVARTLLAQAFPEGDDAVVVIAPLGARHDPAPAARAPSGRAPAPGLSITELPTPTRPGPRGLATVYESTAERPGVLPPPSPGETGARAVPAGLLRCRSVDDLDRVAPSPAEVWLSGSYSLIEPGLVEAADRRLRGRFRWLARDPFAGGRLDGSRFLGAGSVPAGAPVRTVRELASEFAPVARFGFLALPRRRTLAQAALWYALDRPEVVSVCVPLPSPERWEELLGFARSPPLTEAERERIRELSVPASVGRPPAADGG